MLNEAQIYEALQEVKDPEIPVISVVDLGVIRGVSIAKNGVVTVDLTPTFAGCPAIDQMREDIETQLGLAGARAVNVNVCYTEPWSTEQITEKGRKLLKEFGLSPPPRFEGMISLSVLDNAICPVCGSNNTFLMSPFGPTACRAIHHCRNCQETFEQFKPL